MSNFSSYFNDILKRASEITQQRTSNIDKYSQVKRASGIAESGYSGGYKQTTTQPKQKFTGREIAQLRTLQQQAQSINPSITDKLVTSIKDISSAGSKFTSDIVNKSKFNIQQISDIQNLFYNNGLINKAGQVGLANTERQFVPGPNRNLNSWEYVPVSITEENYNKLLQNPTYYNSATRKQENILTPQELSLLKSLNNSSSSTTNQTLLQDFFRPTKVGRTTKNLITNDSIKNFGIPSLTSYNINAENLWDAQFYKKVMTGKTTTETQIDPINIERERYKVNFLEGLKIKENNTEDSFLNKLNSLKSKEEQLLQANLKNPYLSVVDLSGYKSLIADAKAQEQSMFSNLGEYTNTAAIGYNRNGGQQVQFNNIKSGYVDSAKNFGQLMYNSYSAAYNELEKAIQSAKINWDTMNKTKASTLSGLDSILSTIRSKTSASSAQHSLGDTDYNQLKKDLLNQQLEQTTSFSGTVKPRATFISRPS